MSVPLGQWLEFMEQDYLGSFVAAGGSAVKIAVSPEGSSEPLASLAPLAAESGYVFASVDAATTRVERIDQVFCEVARQVDWEGLAAAVRARAIAEHEYVVPQPGFPVSFTTIAAVNQLTPQHVSNTLARWFTENVFRDARMSQDFRSAMMRLCFDPLESSALTDRDLPESLLLWLRGELRLLSAVRSAPIYQKVSRHNARDMLVSLGHWARLAGKPGFVLVLDMRAVAPAKPTAEFPGRGYTRAAVMDLYEVLRQFIDSAGEMEGCFIVAVAAPEFVTDDRRGVEIYHALHMRIAEEVRDRERDNPLATLVRLN